MSSSFVLSMDSYYHSDFACVVIHSGMALAVNADVDAGIFASVLEWKLKWGMIISTIVVGEVAVCGYCYCY